MQFFLMGLVKDFSNAKVNHKGFCCVPAFTHPTSSKCDYTATHVISSPSFKYLICHTKVLQVN